MKNNNGSPSERIEFIADLLRERHNESGKTIPTYFSISIEQYGNNTTVTEKEEGVDNFLNKMRKYTTDYNLSSITISLYRGKSRNVVKAEQTFKIELKKQTPGIVLSGTPEKETILTPEIQEPEHSIPVHRFYEQKYDMQTRLMYAEMDKRSLAEKLEQVKEKYEEKLQHLEKSYAEKLKQQNDTIEELQDEIEDFEKEIAKTEKEKNDSFGNISFGGIASHAVKNLIKSKEGAGLLKGLLGDEGFSKMQGHIAGVDEEGKEEAEEETKPTARIISQPETNNNPKQAVFNTIQQVAENLPKQYLQLFYEIAIIAFHNEPVLKPLRKLAGQLEAVRVAEEAKEKAEEAKAQQQVREEQLAKEKTAADKTVKEKKKEEEDENPGNLPPLRNVITIRGGKQIPEPEEENGEDEEPEEPDSENDLKNIT